MKLTVILAYRNLVYLRLAYERSVPCESCTRRDRFFLTRAEQEEERRNARASVDPSILLSVDKIESRRVFVKYRKVNPCCIYIYIYIYVYMYMYMYIE